MDRDKDTPIMYEPDPTPMLVAPPFNEPVLGNDSQQVFAYHIYCEPNDGANLAARLECLAAQTIFAGNQCCHVCVCHGIYSSILSRGLLAFGYL